MKEAIQEKDILTESYWREKLTIGSLYSIKDGLVTSEAEQDQSILTVAEQLSIKELTGEDNVAEFVVMLSVYAIVLSRYTNQEEVLITSPGMTGSRTPLFYRIRVLPEI